jgi:hypothetical protein
MGNGAGGGGGFGFYDKPITQPFSQPYAIGGPGSGGGFGNGGSGGNSNFTNVATVNAGAAGSGDSTGASGNQPGATTTWGLRNIVVGFSAGSPGNGAYLDPMEGPGAAGNAGGAGALVVFDNTGA